MIVRESTYKAKCQEVDVSLAIAQQYKDMYFALLKKWNKVVAQINSIGGEAVLTGSYKSNQFSQDEISKLILLCHPDKHDGKPMANEMTAKLILLKAK